MSSDSENDLLAAVFSDDDAEEAVAAIIPRTIAQAAQHSLFVLRTQDGFPAAKTSSVVIAHGTKITCAAIRFTLPIAFGEFSAFRSLCSAFYMTRYWKKSHACRRGRVHLKRDTPPTRRYCAHSVGSPLVCPLANSTTWRVCLQRASEKPSSFSVVQ